MSNQSASINGSIHPSNNVRSASAHDAQPRRDQNQAARGRGGSMRGRGIVLPAPRRGRSANSAPRVKAPAPVRAPARGRAASRAPARGRARNQGRGQANVRRVYPINQSVSAEECNHTSGMTLKRSRENNLLVTDAYCTGCQAHRSTVVAVVPESENSGEERPAKRQREVEPEVVVLTKEQRALRDWASMNSLYSVYK